MVNIKIKSAFYLQVNKTLSDWEYSYHQHDRRVSDSDKNLNLTFSYAQVGFENTFDLDKKASKLSYKAIM